MVLLVLLLCCFAGWFVSLSVCGVGCLVLRLVVWSFGWLLASLVGCLVAWCGCVVARVCGCAVVCLCRCVIVWLFICLFFRLFAVVCS